MGIINNTILLFFSIIIAGMLISGSIDHVLINGSVYGDEGNLNQGNKLSKITLVNQSKELASVERVVLYRPYVLTSGEGTDILVENETVVFSGFIQSRTVLRGNSVSLYEVSNDKNKDNLLGTYIINDPISTQFSFKVKITPGLAKASADSGNQLQFKAYHDDVSSNTITANILDNTDEESKYQQIFDPQKYNIPEKVNLMSTYGGKTFNSFAYLYRYELIDKSSGNIEEFVNTEDDVDRFDTRSDYNWNLTSGNSIVSLKFENGNRNPLFLEVFLKQFEFIETKDQGIENVSIPFLYRFDSVKDEKSRFETPLVREGAYSVDIKVFFDDNIRATYVLSKIGIWSR